MRVKHKALVTISEDAEGRNKLLAPDDAGAEVILDGMVEACCSIASLAAAAVFSVPFGSVADARGVYLKSTGDFDLSINGGAAIQVRRGYSAVGTKAANTKFLLEGTLTSVQVTAVDACVLTHAIWGDLAA